MFVGIEKQPNSTEKKLNCQHYSWPLQQPAGNLAAPPCKVGCACDSICEFWSPFSFSFALLCCAGNYLFTSLLSFWFQLQFLFLFKLFFFGGCITSAARWHLHVSSVTAISLHLSLCALLTYPTPSNVTPLRSPLLINHLISCGLRQFRNNWQRNVTVSKL